MPSSQEASSTYPFSSFSSAPPAGRPLSDPAACGTSPGCSTNSKPAATPSAPNLRILQSPTRLPILRHPLKAKRIRKALASKAARLNKLVGKAAGSSAMDAAVSSSNLHSSRKKKVIAAKKAKVKPAKKPSRPKHEANEQLIIGTSRRVNYGSKCNNHSLTKAVAEVKAFRAAGGKGNIVAIARQHGISKTVLYDTFSGKRSFPTASGRNAKMPADLEALLVQHIKDMDDRGQGMTVNSIMTAGKGLAKVYKVPGDLKCGPKWMDGLFERNPDTVMRRQQAFSRTRAGGLNPKSFEEYFEILEEAIAFIEKENGDAHCPECIMNADETGINIDAIKGTRVASRKGKKTVHKLHPKSKGGNRLTMLNLITAGNYQPDCFFVFEGEAPPANQVLPGEGLVCLGEGVDYAFAENGYMTEKIWREFVVPWVIKEVKNMRAQLNKPDSLWVLLVLDGCSAHCYCTTSLEALLENFIKLVRMPSNTSHRLQALDVSCFRPLKAYFRGFLDANGMIDIDGLNKFQLAKIVWTCWKRVIRA